jgi:hypothetical protein
MAVKSMARSYLRCEVNGKVFIAEGTAKEIMQQFDDWLAEDVFRPLQEAIEKEQR